MYKIYSITPYKTLSFSEPDPNYTDVLTHTITYFSTYAHTCNTYVYNGRPDTSSRINFAYYTIPSPSNYRIALDNSNTVYKCFTTDIELSDDMVFEIDGYVYGYDHAGAGDLMYNCPFIVDNRELFRVAYLNNNSVYKAGYIHISGVGDTEFQNVKQQIGTTNTLMNYRNTFKITDDGLVIDNNLYYIDNNRSMILKETLTNSNVTSYNSNTKLSLFFISRTYNPAYAYIPFKEIRIYQQGLLTHCLYPMKMPKSGAGYSNYNEIFIYDECTGKSFSIDSQLFDTIGSQSQNVAFRNWIVEDYADYSPETYDNIEEVYTSESGLLYTDMPPVRFTNALDCKLTLKDNAAGSLSFKLSKDHDMYDKIKIRRSYIAVVEDDNIKYGNSDVPAGYKKVEYLEGHGSAVTCLDDLPINLANGDSVEFDVAYTTAFDNPELWVTYDDDYISQSGNNEPFPNSYSNLLSTSNTLANLSTSNAVAVSFGENKIHTYSSSYDTFWANYYGTDIRPLMLTSYKYTTNSLHHGRILSGNVHQYDDIVLPIELYRKYNVYYTRREFVLDGIHYPIATSILPVAGDTMYPWIGSTYNDVFACGVRVYGATYTIYNNGVAEVHKIIPVVDITNNEGCLYDSYTGNIYRSIGSSSWYCGSDAVESEGLLIKPTWVGRVLSKSKDINNNITYTASGLFDIFADHVIKPIYPNNYS